MHCAPRRLELTAGGVDKEMGHVLQLRVIRLERQEVDVHRLDVWPKREKGLSQRSRSVTLGGKW